MNSRRNITITLIIVAAITALILNILSDEKSAETSSKQHKPDYYMENFSTLTMNQDGTPKNRIFASYMAHYPDDDTTELIEPRMELYKKDKPPINITAEKGWVTSNNEVILLVGKVHLQQNDTNGGLKLDVKTSDVKVLIDQDYAETDKHATIIGKRTVVNTVGMRAYFKKNRVELLNNVRGKIEQPKQIN